MASRSYGYFDDKAAEYVITDPRTPAKWINYVGDLRFGGFVDSTGGGLLCKGDPSRNRMVKYIAQMPASDFKGQTVYARVRRPGAAGVEIITPFFVPGLRMPDQWRCRVGLGYTVFESRYGDLDFEVRVFVPRDGFREIRDYRVTNRGKEALEVDLVPVVEYTHFDALKQLTNADWVPQTMQSHALGKPLSAGGDGVLTLVQAAFMMKGRAENWFTASLPVASFETDRKHFLGDNEYGTWARPLSLEAKDLGNHEARRGDNIAALVVPLGSVAPGATARMATQLGQDPVAAEALGTIARWRDHDAIDAAFAALADDWRSFLSAYHAETPDAGFTTMVNIHNPRQCRTTLWWSRYLSLYQLGFGADRGIGFRDSSQDVLGVMSHDPEAARELIEKLLSVQKADGAAMHQFNPLTMEAGIGDSHEYPDRPHYYSDDHLWIVLAVCAYVKETGKADFLDRVLPFWQDPKAVPGSIAPRDREAPVAEHLRRALAFTHGDTGAHGLPLLGFADWNDTVNFPTGAESVFTAMLYGLALQEMAGLSDWLGKADEAAKYKAWHSEMSATVNAQAWDGDWYVRYFDHQGKAVGTKANDYGQIWLNSNSWSILSGYAPTDRARTAMEAVHQRLNTKHGVKLSAPGYNGYDPVKGGVSTYPPGAKENGGIFLHTNPWAIIALCQLGDGERAWQYYQQINPATRNDRIDEFEVEPYVYPQNILGDEHPQFGLGRNSWLSGTASWAYQAASRWILGVRADWRGLMVDPCIPAAWDGFTVTRRFRGATYRITVKNPRHRSKAAAPVVLPLAAPGTTVDHTVEL